MLELTRAFQEELLVTLLFAPVVFGIFFILVKRVIKDLTELTPFFSSGEFFLFWSIFTGLLIPLSTFYFFRFLVLRIFPVQNSDFFYLSLPLPQWMNFHVMVLDLCVRNLPLVLAYLFATSYFFIDRETIVWFLLGSIPLMTMGLSLLQTLLIPLMLRFRLLNFPGMFFVVILFGLLGGFWGAWGLGGEEGASLFLQGIGVVFLFAWPLSYVLFLQARIGSLYRLEVFLSRDRKMFFRGLLKSLQWVPKRIFPFFVRDLLLTVRGLFSSFLLYPLGVLSLCMAFAYLILSGWTSLYILYWICALGVFTLSSITIPLFRSTFPYLWLDAVHPIDAKDFYFGKIFYAIFISLPIPMVFIGIMFFLNAYFSLEPMDPHGLGTAYLLFRLILLSVFISGTVAGFLFEGEQRPMIHKGITAMVTILITFLMAIHWSFILLMPMVIAYVKDLGLPRLNRIYQEH